MIRKFYKVIVEIPEEIWQRFGNTPEYQRRVDTAIKGYLDAGSDFYSKCYEWATFSTEAEAKECERKLKEVVDYFWGRF